VSFIETTRAVLSGGTHSKALAPAASAQPGPTIYGQGLTRRLSQREASRHLQAYGGTEAVDWVMDAVGLIMTTASQADYHFETNGKKMATSETPYGQGGDYPGGKVPSSLEGLLDQPNPYFDYIDMIELLTIDLLLVGNGYWLKFGADAEGKPIALYRLAPPFVQIVPGEKQLVEKYHYRVPGSGRDLEFAPEDVVHFKLPNPHDPHYGLGVISASPRSYDIELGLVESMAAFFQRGTKLSGVLQSDRSVPEPVHQKIRRQFASMYSGSHNAYQVAVLERGLTFQSIQPTAVEAQFEALSHLGRDRVFQMFGVHPALVNGQFARPGLLEEAQRHFDNKKMKPYLNRLERVISAQISQAWGVDFRIDYEYTIPEADRLNLATSFGGLPGVKVKEVREYVKLPPLGDQRDEIVLNLPGITTADGGIANRQPGPDGGAPANPNNTAAIDQGVPSGGAAVTKPDPAAQQRLKKALAEGPAALGAYLAEVLPPSAGAADAALDRIFDDAEGMTKAQRPALIEAVEREDLLGPEVEQAVSEGVRRGYSPEQILEGVEAEGFAGARAAL